MSATRQDHYLAAREAALERLKPGLDAERLQKLGASLNPEDGTIGIQVLRWRVQVRPEPYAMHLLPEGGEVQIVWQILVLDYLGAERVTAPTGFVSFADFAEGRSYQQAFEGRANARLSRGVGRTREGLLQAARALGGTVAEGDPLRCMFRFFPLVEFQVVRSEADEDFPASCSVLFSDNMLDIFSLEDGIVAAERLVSALEGKTPAARAGAERP